MNADFEGSDLITLTYPKEQFKTLIAKILEETIKSLKACIMNNFINQCQPFKCLKLFSNIQDNDFRTTGEASWLNVYYDIYEMLRRKNEKEKKEKELLKASMSISWSGSRLVFYSEQTNLVLFYNPQTNRPVSTSKMLR